MKIPHLKHVHNFHNLKKTKHLGPNVLCFENLKRMPKQILDL